MEKDLPSESILLQLSLLDTMVNQHLSQQTNVLLPSMWQEQGFDGGEMDKGKKKEEKRRG